MKTHYDEIPYYIVYAGWYSKTGGGDDPNMPEYTIGIWNPCGNNLDLAVKRLNERQQENYDFCGIEILFET